MVQGKAGWAGICAVETPHSRLHTACSGNALFTQICLIMSYHTCALLRAIEVWSVKPLPRKLESSSSLNAFDAIQTLTQRPDSPPRTRPPSATGSQTRATPKRDYFAMQAMQLDKLISWVQGSHGAKDLGEILLASSAACEPIAPHQTLILCGLDATPRGSLAKARPCFSPLPQILTRTPGESGV